MHKISPVFTICMVLLVNNAISQFSSFVDAPTRRVTVNLNSGALEGLIVESTPGEKSDEKEVVITFIFTKLPSVFFDNYEPDEKAIILDFYDTRIGESPLDTVLEHPIFSSQVENTQIDLNKDVAGLRPDMRDIVRIKLFTNFPMTKDYNVEEKFGVINLTFKWSKKIENRYRNQRRWKYWGIPSVALGIAGLGYLAYTIWVPPPRTAPDPLKHLGDPPARPSE